MTMCRATATVGSIIKLQCFHVRYLHQGLGVQFTKSAVCELHCVTSVLIEMFVTSAALKDSKARLKRPYLQESSVWNTYLGNIACPITLEKATSQTCCTTQKTSHKIFTAVSLL